MNAATEENTGQLNALKWVVVILLLSGGIYANYYFADQPLLYRVIGLVVLAGLAGALALATRQGAAFYALLKGAQVEARRVVWPTRQERNQTTLVVVGFILVMALILWGLDSLFGWLTTLVIG